MIATGARSVLPGRVRTWDGCGVIPGIADTVLQLVGHTPMVRLRRLPGPDAAEVVVKLEAFNPAGSVKDRAAVRMIEAAEREGKIRPGDTLVEPTSGNTGIGLAMVAAVKGYRLVITMPDDASPVRRALLRRYGARVILTPAGKLMQGAIERARRLLAEEPRAYMLQQFENEENPAAHRETTAREILDATQGRIDAFVAGVGTGGTLTGVGQVLRRELDAVELVAVEPARAPALQGGTTMRHGIEGIGAGFVPAILDRGLIDTVLACEDADALATSKDLAALEGISAGTSGGAAVWGALQVARRLGAGKRVVTLIPDAWDRYAGADSVTPLSSTKL
jgi:cysteine synthase